MSEYPIQSLSICCPALKCINNCKTCAARQNTSLYENKYHGSCRDAREYWDDLIKRMRYAQSVGCKTVVLTGTNEPQQDRRWLEGLYLAMKSLPEPFVNIEMQTTGALLMVGDFIPFLKEIGVTTIALSVFSLDTDKNAEIMGRTESKVDIGELCYRIKSRGLNVRMCFNVTDKLLVEKLYDEQVGEDIVIGKDELAYIDTIRKQKIRQEYLLKNLRYILHIAESWKIDQVTFRKLWCVKDTPEKEWIEANSEYVYDFLDTVVSFIRHNGGTRIRRLPYGPVIYGYKGISIVVDDDSTEKDLINEDAQRTDIKYYIIREDGKLYCSWNSKASLIL